ncbi:hypothetical protein AAJCM20276_33380 [Acetobacter aceti]|uniref:Uncharacterized protein n=1 Tax=Acetobacter aceti TaxID=435 RepID=A0A6S6PUH5_ACEAC|nr:hypothetical protein AAJCM20276_33380 [Acetobacter aceti]
MLTDAELSEPEPSALESLLLELLLSAEEPELSALLLEELDEDVAEQPDAVAPAPVAWLN